MNNEVKQSSLAKDILIVIILGVVWLLSGVSTSGYQEVPFYHKLIGFGITAYVVYKYAPRLDK
jgi:uncharacterized ion transporter superfamily protein YfcC